MKVYHEHAKNIWRLKKFYLLMRYALRKKIYTKTIYPTFISIIKTVVIMQQKKTLLPFIPMINKN